MDEAVGRWGESGDPDWGDPEPEARGPIRFGPYRLGPLLGEGGMGSVHLAWDTSLGRRVALKIVRSGTQELVQRMFQEAQLQARVEHPAVCRIYQIGEDHGRPFIAMQYIQGAILTEWSPHLNLESKLRLMIQVADAVHAAHRVGLIHRDLKPANMLVEQDEAGTLRPYVLDFGLARDLAGAAITQQGIAVGSPSYMAPEQASGGQVDERTDIYGLGATLYELLTGRPPFRGATAVETVRQVMETDAPMLRGLDPTLPADLESIIHKCLEKDPAARYGSARELRDDLQRFLDGEPVEARRQNSLRRFWGRIKRNRALSLVASGASFLVLLFAVVAFTTWRNGQEQARWAQRFGQQVREMDATLRNAHLFPLHDLRPEKSEVRSRLERIREQLKGLGGASQGPGNLALGQGHLMLGEPEAARRALEDAWEGGYRTPEVALALVEALGELYRQENEAGFLVERAGLRTAVLAQLRAYREVIAPRLLLARQGSALTPQQEALVARIEGRAAEAERLARDASDRQRWNYEARLEEIEALFQESREAPPDQEWSIAARLAEAESVLGWLRETARSDPRVYLADAQERLLRIRLDLPGRPLGQCLREGLAALDRAQVTDPTSGEPHLLRAHLYFWMSLRLPAQPAQASYWLDRAVEASSQAASDPTTRLRAQAYQGSLLLHRAQLLQAAGKDPTAAVTEGGKLWRQALQEGLAAPTLKLLGPLELAFSQVQLADYAAGHGRDPLPALGAAQDAYRKVLQVDPGNDDATLELALVQRRLGDDAARKGGSPDAHYREARGHLEAYLNQHGDSHQAWNYLGTVAQGQAEAAGQRGAAGRAALDAAVSAFARALSLQPSNPRYVLHLQQAQTLVAEDEFKLGRDPEAWIQKALDSLDAGRTEAGSPALAWEFSLGRAQTLALRAEALARSGRSPAAPLKEAEREARAAAAKGFRQPEAWTTLGELLLLRERCAFPRTSARGLAEARQAFQRATRINAADPDPWLGLAQVDLLDATARPREVRSVAALLGSAEAQTRKALALNPRSSTGLLLQAEGALARGLLQGAPVGRAALQQAVQFTRATLAINPGEEGARRIQTLLETRGNPEGGHRLDPALDTLLDRLKNLPR